jgi:PAS domain S-box-containing protein
MTTLSQPAGKRLLEGTGVRRLPLVAGAAVAALGLLVIIAWMAHWPTVIQILPHLAPMKFNTALGFVFCGTTLMLLETRFAKLAVWTSAIPAIVAIITLLEYFTGADLKIDQLAIRDYVFTATSFAGRMSPLAATCFILISAGLVCAAAGRDGGRPLAAAGLLGCMVAVVACVATFGYLVGIEMAYGWGAYTRMAVHTAVAFLTLGTGLLTWTWQRTRRGEFNFLRWLPVTGSLTLIVMIGSISAVSFAQLRSSSDWRKHSYQVLVKGQTFLGDIFATQRGMRNFVLTSQPSALDVYNSGLTNAPRHLAGLIQLTRDNPGQQMRLKVINEDLRALLNYGGQLLATRKTQGLQAAVQIESNGRGFAMVRKLVEDLQNFTDAEQALLDERSAVADADFRNTARLLLFGSVMAAALIAFANWMTSREMAGRRRAEERQASLAAELKGLMESTGEGIYGIDVRGNCTFINRAAARLIGFEPEDVHGKNMHELIHHSRSDGSPYPVAECPVFLAFKSDLSCRVDSEVFWRKDGSAFSVEYTSFPIVDNSEIKGAVVAFTDITERRQREAEREKLIADLQCALAEVKTLSGLIPICGWCKSVRSDTGYWQSVEQYIRVRTDATFSHGMCPNCASKFKGDIARANSSADTKQQIG